MPDRETFRDLLYLPPGGREAVESWFEDVILEQDDSNPILYEIILPASDFKKYVIEMVANNHFPSTFLGMLSSKGLVSDDMATVILEGIEEGRNVQEKRKEAQRDIHGDSSGEGSDPESDGAPGESEHEDGGA